MGIRDDLTPLEGRLVECAAAGDVLDCAPTGATIAELDQIDDWEERKIRAEILVALCTAEEPDWSVHLRRGLRLRGAYIAGRVDLSRAQMTQCPLAFHTCRFEKGVDLYQTSTTDLSFTSCALPSLNGAALHSSGSLNLTGTRLSGMSLVAAEFRGDVELVAAEFRGDVKPSEVPLSNPEGTALYADGMRAGRMSLRGTHVEGAVRLTGATLSGNLFYGEGTRLSNPGGVALYADGMRARRMSLRGTHVEGAVRLTGATLGGNLFCGKGTRLSNPGGVALGADGMSARYVLLRGTHVEGAVRLMGVNIAGQLAFDEGTKLINPKGMALLADNVSAGNVLLRGTHVEGEVRLADADIAGQLAFDEGTKLINPGGVALSTDGMSARHVLLVDTHIEGEVRFSGADIAGQLAFDEGTKLINSKGVALSAESCQVGGSLVLRLREAIVGNVNLTYARVGALIDNLASWPQTYTLVGFSYHSLGGDENPDRRLRWISNSEPFSPHVYTQLAEVYRRSGHEGFARQVSIRREQERARQPDLSRWVRAWNRFLGLTVAYGYQPWRALAPLVVLFVLGWILFTLPPAQEAMVRIKGSTSAAACHERYPCFSPPMYVLDALLPIVDLHQERNWVPARPRPWGLWYEVLTWMLIASGWVLTTAVAAGIGSLWRRE